MKMAAQLQRNQKFKLVGSTKLQSQGWRGERTAGTQNGQRECVLGAKSGDQAKRASARNQSAGREVALLIDGSASAKCP